MKLRFFSLILLCLMFLVFAALQWNDPDPAVWIAVYLSAAVLCGMASWQKLPRWVFGVAFLIFGVAGVAMWPLVYQGILFDMQRSPAIEEARESLGLSICAFAMALCFFLTPRQKHF
ncbi:transmembrane 220 family protein [Rufibacter roseus]|uniref:Transmembrane 220 family protein n=1 Tax=Rufibacter roseus TaxID=1567108 RepID=A0ABW2DLE6_9BACT|nr:transmembrane 220 family protein [Rufibacter roseus]